MKHKTLALLLLTVTTVQAQDYSAFGITAGAIADQPQIMSYRGPGHPLRIILPIGDTRLVHWPTAVRLIMPTGRPDGLRETISGSTVYWTAAVAFEPQAMTLEPLDGAEPYHVLLSAAESGGTAPLQVFDLPDITGEGQYEMAPPGPAPIPVEATGALTEEPPVVAKAAVAAPPPKPVGYVALLRHAAQSLYAPARLHPRHPQIFNVPIQPKKLHLIRGGLATATVHAQWRSQRWVITAVVLDNNLPQPLLLDPTVSINSFGAPNGGRVLKDSDIRGNWRMYGFQHPVLQRDGARDQNGEPLDVTTMYLISDGDLLTALEYQP